MILLVFWGSNRTTALFTIYMSDMFPLTKTFYLSCHHSYSFSSRFSILLQCFVQFRMYCKPAKSCFCYFTQPSCSPVCGHAPLLLFALFLFKRLRGSYQLTNILFKFSTMQPCILAPRLAWFSSILCAQHSSQVACWYCDMFWSILSITISFV